MNHPSTSVLVVVAEVATRRALARGLGATFEVQVAEAADGARSLLEAGPVDVMLVDAALVEELASLGAGVGATLVALGRAEQATEVLEAGAVALLASPPLDLDWAAAAVRRAAHLARALRAAATAATMDLAVIEDRALVASSPGMRAVQRTLRRAAGTSANAMVLGEAGSGVSLVAHALLSAEEPARRRVREIASGAAASGADPTAWLVAAGTEDGDLILDRVEELDERGQQALAALLVARDAVPARTRGRLVVTADPSLRERVRQGTFRRELFHALATVLLEVPPLRQREDDLPLLAHLLLRRAALRLGRPEVRRVGVEAIRALRAHAWPGNVSELADAIAEGVLAVRGEVLLASHLPFADGARSPKRRREGEVLSAVLTSDLLDLPHAAAKEQAVQGFDRAYAEAMLLRASGNTSQAARAAGMDRSNFKRLLRRSRRQKVPTASTAPEGGGVGGESQ